jgi:transposase
LRKQAVAVIAADGVLRRKYELLLSISGVSVTSAVRILAETCILPEGMSARQWVAHAGLDPAHRQSGTSLNLPARISRAGNANLRRALFFPAMVAATRDPPARAFAEKLVRKGKKKIQALVAVMRKLLHAIWGMFKSSTTFDSAVLFPLTP